MLSFQRERLRLKYSNDSQLVVKIFTINTTWVLPIKKEVKENHGHVTHGPTERSQGVV